MWKPIDEIDRDGLMELLNDFLKDEAVEMDNYEESLIHNQAQQIIYKSISQKFALLSKSKKSLKTRRVVST